MSVKQKNYSASNGRSSENNAPFFNIHKKGKGYIFAIGWSGQWNCSITRDFDSVTFKSKIEDTCFRLMPGESIRTSSIVILPYEGDFDYSQNIWRKLVKTEFSPIGKGDIPGYAPIAASIWGGMTTKSALEKINVIAENNLPYETACFKLRGLNENSDYLFRDIDGGEFTVSGSELTKNGFNITVPEKRTAKIFFYKEV